MKPIRVLVVDDSALVRSLLTHIIDGEPDMEVVGTAADPYVAREKIKRLAPSVITLDVEMPRMNGIVFLERLMRLHPIPVVMLSSLTERGAETTLRALTIGAVDFVTKPSVGVRDGLARLAEELAPKLRAAAQARVGARGVRSEPVHAADAILPFRPASAHGGAPLIAIGASTGGTEALQRVLSRLPRNAPPIVVVQHMPAGFTRSFAERLDGMCAMTVREAAGGERLAPGIALIAPGDAHLLVRKSGDGYVSVLDDGPPVGRHRPAVDVLFRSVANAGGDRATGVLLTGMGRDGAEGLHEMLQRGGETIAQDQATSLVYGMPRAAVEIGAARLVTPLERIAETMLRAAESRVSVSR